MQFWASMIFWSFTISFISEILANIQNDISQLSMHIWKQVKHFFIFFLQDLYLLLKWEKENILVFCKKIADNNGKTIGWKICQNFGNKRNCKAPKYHRSSELHLFDVLESTTQNKILYFIFEE